MPTSNLADLERRVLVFAPIGRDGALTREFLERASISAFVCSSLEEVCVELSQQAGAVILTEEALDDSGFPLLTAAIDRQPPWSDVPVILFTGGSPSSG